MESNYHYIETEAILLIPEPIYDKERMEAAPKMSSMPFHESVKELMTPVLLETGKSPFSPDNWMNISFKLHPEDIHMIKNVGKPVEIFIRFCLSEHELKEVDDLYPADLKLFVNEVLLAQSKGRNMKAHERHSVPVNITKYINVEGVNNLTVTWGYDRRSSVDSHGLMHTNIQKFLMRTFLCHPMSVQGVAEKIQLNSKDMGIRRTHKTLSNDEEALVPVNMRLTLECPISKGRIRIPCKGVNCTHAVYFDLWNFLEINKNNFKLYCAICNDRLTVEQLSIDFLLLKVFDRLKDYPSDSVSVNIKQERKSFKITVERMKRDESQKKKRDIEIVMIE